MIVSAVDVVVTTEASEYRTPSTQVEMRSTCTVLPVLKVVTCAPTVEMRSISTVLLLLQSRLEMRSISTVLQVLNPGSARTEMRSRGQVVVKVAGSLSTYSVLF